MQTAANFKRDFMQSQIRFLRLPHWRFHFFKHDHRIVMSIDILRSDCTPCERAVIAKVAEGHLWQSVLF